MKATLFAAVVISTLASCVYCYPRYQQEIPNGAMVPNPCDPSTKWNGVGHQSLMGKGPRNPFGEDFAANGHTWNKTLCDKDSDGDGLSNGQELGDPTCTWTAGQSPERTVNLTHPGICEPLGSATCNLKNAWLKNCSNAKFDCPAINDPGVKNFTMRFPPTPVPLDDATYICKLFRLPNDSEADIIAIEPVIDNLAVIHHMLLYGCTGDVSDINPNAPYFCEMSGGMNCKSLIGIWPFGGLGQCLNSQLGFRIGPTGYRHAIVQIHWDNHLHRANQTDSSGIKISYTNNLRPHRGEILIVGQDSLEIPPGVANVTLSGSCSALCTKAVMNQSVYITSSILHMHLLGKNGIIRLYRNGQLLQVIEEVTSYDYNTPTIIEFKTPIEMKPGDSIKVDCTFDSTRKNTTTYFGEGTYDEMCYGFFAYYTQIRDFAFCGQWKSIAFCGDISVMSDRCDMPTFLTHTSLLPTLCSANCSNSNCTNALDAALMTGCQRDEDVLRYLEEYQSPDLLAALARCAFAQQPASTVCTTPVPSDCSLMRSYSVSIPPMLAFMVFICRLF